MASTIINDIIQQENVNPAHKVAGVKTRRQMAVGGKLPIATHNVNIRAGGLRARQQGQQTACSNLCAPALKVEACCSEEQDMSVDIIEHNEVSRVPNAELISLALQLPDPDCDDSSNVVLASENVKHIFTYLNTLEKLHPLSADFMVSAASFQIQPRFRFILVDWIVAVQVRFSLLPETLYLAIALLDRYLQKKGDRLAKDRLQLLGVTCVYLAAKYEEMFPPDVNDFVFITDNTYTVRDVRLMEIDILDVMNFFIGFPLPIHFLRRYSKVAKVTGTIHALAKYVLELTLLDTELAAIRPSAAAAVSLYLSVKLLNDRSTSQWTNLLRVYSGYDEEQLQPLLPSLSALLLRQNNTNSRYRAVKNKYADARMLSISNHEVVSGPLLINLAASAVEK